MKAAERLFGILIIAATLSAAPASAAGAAPSHKVADVANGSVAVDGHRVVFKDAAGALVLYDSRDGSWRIVLPATDCLPLDVSRFDALVVCRAGPQSTFELLDVRTGLRRPTGVSLDADDSLTRIGDHWYEGSECNRRCVRFFENRTTGERVHDASKFSDLDARSLRPRPPSYRFRNNDSLVLVGRGARVRLSGCRRGCVNPVVRKGRALWGEGRILVSHTIRTGERERYRFPRRLTDLMRVQAAAGALMVTDRSSGAGVWSLFRVQLG